MARRMTSMEVTDTDAFLDMGQGSQLLYFHLNQRADDDGFVSNPKKVMRMIGSSEDDLKVLLGKRFLIGFPDGVCVIKHWRINNFIRKDIYKPTKYLDLKQTLFIKANGAYTLTDEGEAIPVPPGHFSGEYVNEALTSRQPRLGKVSKDKESKEEENKIPFETFWNLYDKKIGVPKSQAKWEKLPLKDQEAIIEYIPKYKRATPDKKFRKNPETFLNNRSWEDEILEEGIATPEPIKRDAEAEERIRLTLEKNQGVQRSSPFGKQLAKKMTV